tara:strand:- start:719 stop:2527 length:1809 start_codon:yes stop_codon:yes gene_type:complete
MEIPKSPFTLEGLKQSGISAFNQLRTNPIRTLTSPMIPKNPYLATGMAVTGIYGLLPESTKKFLTEGLPGGDLDRDFALREVEKAKARQAKPKERPTFSGILDYMETDDFENQKLTDDIVEKSKVKIKEDDVETGPEKLENKTPDLQVKKETVIENNTPNNNKNNTQMAVQNQKNSIKKSEQIASDLEAEARKQGKMTVLNDALEAARGVMGERGYDKSGRLLLLQLASGLLSGKTMQPGITGFLDVLGQAGQQVIPMAIALEREREKDEMDLAKLLIEADQKTTKLKPPTLKIRYKLPNGDISDPVPASLTERGSYIVYDQIGNESVRMEVTPDQVIGQVNIGDNQQVKSKLLSEYKAVKSGELYTNTFIKVAANNPDLIGPTGGWTKLTLKAGELLKMGTNSKSYRETIAKLADNEKTNYEEYKAMGGLVEDGVDEKIDNIFKKIEALGDDLESSSEKIQAQALLETLELLSTYSLAQTLKDKDRLAVADIQRAEKRLGGTVGYLPFYDNNPTEIITAYKVVNDKFKNRLTGIRNQWKDIYYYNPLELDSIDKSYAEQLADQKTEKINAFIEGYDENNPNSSETFNNLFNADDLKGIIQE